MRQIKVTISKTNEITVTPSGFSGEACKEATKGVIAALGGKVESDVETPEMFNEASTENTNLA